jgi:hypothetical protein
VLYITKDVKSTCDPAYAPLGAPNPCTLVPMTGREYAALLREAADFFEAHPNLTRAGYVRSYAGLLIGRKGCRLTAAGKKYRKAGTANLGVKPAPEFN